VQKNIENERGTKSAANECYTSLPMNTLYNMDCMNGMALFPDKFFDLAIVDPPYGDDRIFNGSADFANKVKQYDNVAPDKAYFDELFRVSKNQIIWGGNYFILPPSSGWIIWDKVRFVENYSRYELAFTSFRMNPRMFTYCNNGGFVVANEDRPKIHPSQKPRKLYRWILSNYAEDCETILDTHAGSCSSCIEFEIGGFEWIAFEKDTDYFNDAKERMKRELAQTRLDLQV